MIAAYREVFRIGSFRSFWLGFTFSELGDAVTRVALTWYVYETTRSARALGLLMLCYTGPVVVGGLLAGTLLDRYDRRQVMLVDSVVRGTAVALIPVLSVAGQLALWHVYAIAAVYGFLMMVSLAGGPALVPSLVGREHLSTANALETLSFTLGSVIGPVLAGLLIGVVGTVNVIWLDAISYFAFAGALARLRLAEPEPNGSGADGDAYRLPHAVRLLLVNRVLRSTTLMFMAFNVGGGFLAVWLPILTDRVLGGGAGLYGTLLGLQAVGGVASALLAGGRAFAVPLGTLICGAQLLSGASVAVMLIGPGVWTVVAGLVGLGAFSAPLTIWAQTLRMQIIPERLRGRTFALLRMLMQSGNPLGGAIAGGLLPILGLPAMIALSALVIGAPGIAGYRVKELHSGNTRQEKLVEAER
ncbi:MAG: MFS transporter [Gemmatimonadales bacterium]